MGWDDGGGGGGEDVAMIRVSAWGDAGHTDDGTAPRSSMHGARKIGLADLAIRILKRNSVGPRELQARMYYIMEVGDRRPL